MCTHVIGSDDMWRATVLCEKENVASRIGGIVARTGGMCLYANGVEWIRTGVMRQDVRSSVAYV